jgi:hypothetical protein
MAFKHTNTLICDEVRVENTGKFIIIGLYTGPIGVPQIPIGMQITFMHFLESDRPGFFSAKLRVEHLETGRRLIEGQAQIQVAAPGMVIAPMKMPLQIDREGQYNFIFEVDGLNEPIITPFSVTIVRMPQQPGTMPMR